MSGEETFGARFLEEWKRLGGPLAGWSYAEIQELRACDREAMVDALRRNSPLVGYAALQRVRAAESPEELAREALGRAQSQAAAMGTMWMMIAMLG